MNRLSSDTFARGDRERSNDDRQGKDPKGLTKSLSTQISISNENRSTAYAVHIQYTGKTFRRTSTEPFDPTHNHAMPEALKANKRRLLGF